MTTAEIIQIITGTFGSIGFAILFNVRGNRLVAVALGGFLSWLLFVLFQMVIPDEAICYFLVATLISLYAEGMARLLKTPTTLFICPSLVPLIPGASLYYTMSYAMQGENGQFVEKAINTLKLASALALGIVASAVLMKLILRVSQSARSARGSV